MSIKRWFVPLGGVGLIIFAILVVWGVCSVTSCSAPPGPPSLPAPIIDANKAAPSSLSASSSPTIAWTPASLNETVGAGLSKTDTVSFTASKDLSNIIVRVVPELQPYVQVSPASFATVTAGQTNTVNLTLSAPATALPSIIDGTIQLRDTRGNTVARPLAVTQAIVWPQTGQLPNGVTYSYSTFGQPGHVEIEQNPDQTIGTNVVFAAPGQEPGVQYAVNFVPNLQRLSLLDWFSKNVDLTGAIIAAGTFSIQGLPNGMHMLILGELPAVQSETTGPIPSLYASSPDNSTIVAIEVAQDNDFGLLGIDSTERSTMFVEVLKSMTFN